MSPTRRPLVESIAAAVFGYIGAGAIEATFITLLRPTEWELAWVSDAALAMALGIAVFLWRHLVSTRRELADRERAEVVVETQLSVAADIQRRLLPAVPPRTNGFEWAAALRSAGKIGGDFYDFVEVAPSVWVAIVADVSGKGIPAAMALGSFRTAFRTIARQSSDPARLVTHLSTVLFEEWRGAPYVTCIVATFDLAARTLTYVNAGHPAGIVAGRSGVRHLDRGGPPAGLLQNSSFDQARLQLQDGDVCLLVSDGVTEALEGGAPIERVLATSLDCRGAASADELCQLVMASALASDGPVGLYDWNDDRTVVVVRVCESRAVGRDMSGVPGRAFSDGERQRMSLAVVMPETSAP